MMVVLCLATIAQPVTVTFIGRDAKDQPVQLNRVVITNLTQNWQETIYYPDTILMMGSTGINDVDNANGFKLSQNVPNPFDGTTDFALQLPEAGKVSLTVYDLNGKKITAYQGKLAAGVHTFRVLLNTTQSYLLTARYGNETATIKMINNGNAGENAIRHLGEGNLNMLLKNGTKGTTDKPFAFGDNMMYIGFATIKGKEYTSQTIEKRQVLSETLVLNFEATVILPPTVQTATVSEITSNSAACGGNVVDDGGSTVTTRGVCWSTQPNPVFSESHTADGSGTGSFESALTGLTYGTTYYVRAYAVNSIGVAYGETQSFMTVNVTPPVVTTATVSNITHNSATCGGTVVDMGATITARGVCWGTMPNPTIGEGNFTNDGQGAGSFVSNMVNLTGSTLYYVRAYATTEDGTFYGEATSFTTAAVQLPVAVTNEVSNIGFTSAECGGTVIDMGTLVIARGVCWSTSHNPTIEDAHTNDGSGAGTFTSQLSNLEEMTTYYVRAYATNSNGTAYGEEKSFTTLTLGLPRVTTGEIGDVTYETAICGGVVSLEGGSSVTTRGVCWATWQNPYIYANKKNCTIDGNGTGNYTSKITGLNGGTTYYVRAYATNSNGTAYGEEKSFTTLPPVLPIVSINTISDITIGSAICESTVITTGGASIADCGVCWSTSQHPSVNDSHTSDNIVDGVIISNLTGLKNGTTYYVRAYATNSVGTAYSNEIRFVTVDNCPSTVKDKDDNIYNSIQIGNQCWMKENLKTTKYADGTPIAQGNGTSTTVAYWYYPENNSVNKNKYGLLYNWKAVMRNASSTNTSPSGVQGVCPTGWHVPSDREFQQLTKYVYAQPEYRCEYYLGSYIDKSLASTTDWNSSTNTCAVGNNQEDNNATGFSAVASGYYYGGSSGYTNIGTGARFWSSTDSSSEGFAINLPVDYDENQHYTEHYGVAKTRGLSVRCLRD